MNPDLKARLSGKKAAFVSVFDKEGLAPLAKALTEQYGYVLLSTGGTRKYLEEHGVAAIETSEITGFDELLGGRVKSLHPEIFAAILAESAELADPSVPFTVDTVIVNLYPFEAERERIAEAPTDDEAHMLHFIDIGGSALLRAAAKSHPRVNVLGSPEQYEAFLAEMEKGGGATSPAFRKRLAIRAFAQTAYYDGMIQQYLLGQLSREEQRREALLPDTLSLPLSKITDLRYGENPHQKAALYGLARRRPDFEALHGKELSYNNILDMQAAWNIATEFTESSACVIVKHNNPCGVAISPESPKEAFQAALDTDPLSAFGGVVAFNQPVTAEVALYMKDIFLEVIVAPDFEPEAYETLSTKKNLRLVKRPFPSDRPTLTDFKQVSDELFLVQGVDLAKSAATKGQTFRIATDQKPTDEQIEDMAFAWKIVRHVKSNAIVLAKKGRTVGIGGGQTSRIGALEHALKLACDEAKDCVMASDGFLPHIDNIHAAAQARVGAIIQPGGSIRDSEVIDLANQYHIAMITTGVREFRH